MKQIKPNCFYGLPSGLSVYPSRLIQRDGTLMWKDACISNSKFFIPENIDVENNIVHTARRLEELNTWISPTMPAWETFNVYLWYHPSFSNHLDGGTVRFSHDLFDSEHLYKELKPHLQEGEALIFNASDNLVVYMNSRLTAASVSRDNLDCLLGD